ncbi:MAG: hypothetical protein IPK16_25570 [Anaerolineales bacterium]|nr:hypothetical protein [Anaerolineales bacterium]
MLPQRWNWGLVLALLLAVLIVGAASAADPPVLARSVIAGGGATVSHGSVVLYATVGEAAVAGPNASGPVRLAAGYWRDIPAQTLFLPALGK